MVPVVDQIIETSGLTKRFGRSVALDGLDLAVREGEVHGFLGPNGAGKSTTLRILLGLVRRSGGAATVLGRDPWADAVAVHRDLAYVPGDVSLWPNLSGGEAIDLLTRMRGGADPDLRARLIRDFDFDPRKKARGYSKGNRQKVALIAAFARRARLYLLDEPTSGLDPLMEEVFRREVERVRGEGATVLLSSHILSEVERLCERVTIIRAGKAVESGTLADLRHLTRTSFRVVSSASADALARIDGVHDVQQQGDALAFDVDTEALGAVLPELAAAGVTGLTVTPPSLEELFLRHYGDQVAS
jgi:ABC-2 type transport system ATP-binding protein